MRRHLPVLALLVTTDLALVNGYGILIRDDHDEEAEGHFPPTTNLESLPRSFSWREVPGIGSLLTVGGNQHIPKYCGACYAFGALHTLQDRVKVRPNYYTTGTSRWLCRLDRYWRSPRDVNAKLALARCRAF